MANILITGGSRGIGAEAVRQFTAAGHKVVFTYHKSEIEADLLRQETGATPVRCDVKHHDSVKIAVDKAVSVLGQIDVLICSAAIAGQGLISDMDISKWEEVINHESYICKIIEHQKRCIYSDVIQIKVCQACSCSHHIVDCNSRYSNTKTLLFIFKEINIADIAEETRNHKEQHQSHRCDLTTMPVTTYCMSKLMKHNGNDHHKVECYVLRYG